MKSSFKRCYEVLEVEPNSDQNTIRRAYIEIVKRVHPDSQHPESNAEKFQEVDECFKVLMEKFAKRRRNIELDEDEEVQVFDIRHTAPQHRQFLTYDGFGIGSPYQREKQYQQLRVMKAQENVLEHRLQKSAAAEKDLIKKGGGSFFKKHAVKTKYGFDRVVEDLIQEAMSKGDFQNLSGVGKPLKNHQNENPYVDFSTHKINKILIDNGFTPEWINLGKEIRDEVNELKSLLREERCYLEFPKHEQKWNDVIENFGEVEKRINKKIDNFNLIVPVLQKQMVHVRLNEISEKIKQEEPEIKFRDESNRTSSTTTTAASDYENGFFSIINSIMK